MKTVEKLPVTELPGFLVADKTTFLNKILANREWRKVTVIFSVLFEVNVCTDMVDDGAAA